MEIKFDPMTGEPIKKAEEPQEEMNFDPMTGEPIKKAEEPQEEMNFDPMTGEPIKKAEEPQEEMNFDPMTGEPIKKAQPQMQFDPMTGQPVYGNAVSNQGVPTGKKKGKIFGKGFGIAAAIICVCIIAFAGIKSGAFLGKPQKVLLATVNTLTDSSHLMKNLEGIKVLQSRSCTANVSVDFSDGDKRNKVEAVYAQKPSEKQVYGSLDLYRVPEIEFVTAIDKEEVKAQIPLLGNDVYTYNYTTNQYGDLEQLIGSQYVDAINEGCKTLYSGKKEKKQVKELVKTLYGQYKKLDFRATGKEYFEVNGKDRKCKGYKTTVDEAFMKDLIFSLEDYAEKNLGDAVSRTYYLKNTFSQMENAWDGMPDIDVTFYLYKNKLACIQVEDKDGMQQWIFHGGKTRMQNMELRDEDDTIMEVEGTVNGKVEESSLYNHGKKAGTLEYNYKTGEYALDLGEDERYDGTLKKNHRGFTFTLDADEVQFSLDISKGAKLKKLSGNKVDLCEASEKEIKSILQDFNSALYDSGSEAW